MKETFAFWKMSGGGNDFIVLDGTSSRPPALGAQTIRRLCLRGLSIGADGIIAIVPSDRADARMIHWNSDGGESAFCGNGARCAARFCFEADLTRDKLSLETGSGVSRAEILKRGNVRVQAPLPPEPLRRLSLRLAGEDVTADFVIVGVPHLVVEVESVKDLDVRGLGLALRRHPDLGAEGANVHFVQRALGGIIEIRSYERGVEDETLACGSGAVAVALWAREREGESGPVTLRPRSGIPLTVRPEMRGDEETLWLEGDARIIYRGFVTEEADEGFPS